MGGSAKFDYSTVQSRSLIYESNKFTNSPIGAQFQGPEAEDSPLQAEDRAIRCIECNPGWKRIFFTRIVANSKGFRTLKGMHNVCIRCIENRLPEIRHPSGCEHIHHADNSSVEDAIKMGRSQLSGCSQRLQRLRRFSCSLAAIPANLQTFRLSGFPSQQPANCSV